MSKLTITARCIRGHEATLTPEQVKEAQQIGCAFCHCGAPMIVKTAATVARTGADGRGEVLS